MSSAELLASAGPLGRAGRRPMPQLTRSAGLVLGLIGVVVVALISLRIGTRSVSTRSVWDALFHYDITSYDQTVVRSLRLPRTIVALGVGSALAVAGATMQAVTRNPLAEPSILGVSSGASFAVVTVIYYLNLTSPAEYIWFAFAGAMIASILVFFVGSLGRDGATPVKLALAGVVVSALLGSWTSTLLLLDQETFDVVRFWFAGSVVGRDLHTFWVVSPFLLGGSLGCLLLGHQLNVLNLGDDAARGLGMRTNRVRIMCSILVVLITGAAVATAGPIAYVGLAVPHMVRSVIGPDYRWVLPYSFLVGAIFLTGADIVGRIVARTSEIQVGIVTAAIGAPFLIYLARHRSVVT
jgi:iron complex transport system permease protein